MYDSVLYNPVGMMAIDSYIWHRIFSMFKWL